MKKAIIFILTAGILILGACTANNSNVPTTQSPDATEQIKSIKDAVEGQTVIHGEAGAQDEEVPEPGKAILSQDVSNSVKSPGNAEAFFYVQLKPNFNLGQDFKFEGKTYDEYWDVPEIEAYNTAYETWMQDVFPTLDEEMKAAEARGEEQAQGWEKRNPQDYFDVYYEHSQSEEVVTAWKAALDKALAFNEAYNEWLHSDEYNKMEYELLKSEESRLKEKKYLIELKGWDIKGYLTKEQIESFDCGEYGYVICWGGKEDPMDE